MQLTKGFVKVDVDKAFHIVLEASQMVLKGPLEVGVSMATRLHCFKILA